MTKRGTGAGLIIEFLLAVFLFVIIAVIFMAFMHSNMQLDATAHILSVDAPLTCEMTLTNLMRTEASGGVTYPDLIMDTYLKNSHLDAEERKFEGFTSKIDYLFDKVYGKGTDYNNNWTISITLPNGKVFMEHGEIDNKIIKGRGNFTCDFYIPYSASMIEEECKYHYPMEEEIKTKGYIELLDKNGAKLNVEIQNELAKEGKEEIFGIASLTDEFEEQIEIKEPAESPYDEGFGSSSGITLSLNQLSFEGIFTTDYHDSADFVIGVFEYGGVHYELTAAEKFPDHLDSSGLVRVLLRRRQQIEDCSLKVTLALPGTKIYESYEEYEYAQKKLEKEKEDEEGK